MSFRFSGWLMILASVMLVSSSCSQYQKTLKSGTYDQKYDMAVKQYEKDDFFKASSLFEEVIPIFKGTSRAEKTLYYHAMCQYQMGDNMMAAYYFENFVKTYPNSDSAEKCMFLTAKCYFLDSPVATLDQTNTMKAVQTIELFISRYPNSSNLVQCHEMLDGLRIKLETKYFEIAKLYFNMEQYKATISEVQNLLRDFPDTQYREEAMYMQIKASYDYAFNSILIKKADRYKAAMEAYYAYVDAFPNGKFLSQAQVIFGDAIRQIEKMPKS